MVGDKQAASWAVLCWNGIFQSSGFMVCACEIPIKQWGNMHHDCRCLYMLDMDCDNLVYFLLCEGWVLPGVVFPGFFPKKFFINLFSGLFRFRTKDCKRSLILPNEMYGMQGFLKSDSLFHTTFSLSIGYMTLAKGFFQHASLFLTTPVSHTTRLVRCEDWQESERVTSARE